MITLRLKYVYLIYSLIHKVHTRYTQCIHKVYTIWQEILAGYRLEGYKNPNLYTRFSGHKSCRTTIIFTLLTTKGFDQLKRLLDMLNSWQKQCIIEWDSVSLKKITNNKPETMRLIFQHSRVLFPQTNKYQSINFLD